MEQAGRVPEAAAGQEVGHRQEAVLAEQRPELGDDDEEGEQVDDGQRPLEAPAGQPVVGRVEPPDGRRRTRRRRPRQSPGSSTRAGAGTNRPLAGVAPLRASAARMTAAPV